MFTNTAIISTTYAVVDEASGAEINVAYSTGHVRIWTEHPIDKDYYGEIDLTIPVCVAKALSSALSEATIKQEEYSNEPNSRW